MVSWQVDPLRYFGSGWFWICKSSMFPSNIPIWSGERCSFCFCFLTGMKWTLKKNWIRALMTRVLVVTFSWKASPLFWSDLLTLVNQSGQILVWKYWHPVCFRCWCYFRSSQQPSIYTVKQQETHFEAIRWAYTYIKVLNVYFTFKNRYTKKTHHAWLQLCLYLKHSLSQKDIYSLSLL